MFRKIKIVATLGPASDSEQMITKLAKAGVNVFRINFSHSNNEKVKDYIDKIKSKFNVIYSDYGDYFDDFANSDAIIEDCGSFLTEYFYTQKPHCYMLKSPDDIENKFIDLGKKCLDNCYIAYNETEIVDFIENVVIKENDPKKKDRESFSKLEVMYNYPNAALAAVKHLREVLRWSYLQ